MSVGRTPDDGTSQKLFCCHWKAVNTSPSSLTKKKDIEHAAEMSKIQKQVEAIDQQNSNNPPPIPDVPKTELNTADDWIDLLAYDFGNSFRELAGCLKK